MRILFIGAPGSGKGTQAALLANKYNIPQIAIGDIFRDAVRNASSIGLKAKAFMDAGELVPDNIAIEIMRERLQSDDTNNGYILDGFPRTVEQSNSLSEILASLGQSLDFVLNLQVSDADLVQRLLKRSTEQGRSDDSEDIIRVRIETYNNKTKPLLDYYEKEGLLKVIDGVGDVNLIQERINNILS